MMKKVKDAASYSITWLETDQRATGKEPYIKPSSLARGCLLYIAFELQGKPKPPFDARVGRILSVGTDSHRRLQRGLSRACLGQEVFFEIPEYRIHGFCDGILYVPPDKVKEGRGAGFWALEFKTTAASEFDKLKAAKVPKEEHIRQAQIYLWGLNEQYQGAVPLQGAIIYYENRDTLEHLAYEVYPDPEMMAELGGPSPVRACRTSFVAMSRRSSATSPGSRSSSPTPTNPWARSCCGDTTTMARKRARSAGWSCPSSRGEASAGPPRPR